MRYIDRAAPPKPPKPASRGAASVGAAVGHQAPPPKQPHAPKPPHPPKKPPGVAAEAALKTAFPNLVGPKAKQRAISEHISHYAENPRAHSQALRKLGYSAAQLRVIHRNQTRPDTLQNRLQSLQARTDANIGSGNQAMRHKTGLGPLGDLNDVAGMVLGAKPSEMPHNILRNVERLVPGTQQYDVAQHGPKYPVGAAVGEHSQPLTTPNDVSIIPWGPFGKGLRTVKAEAKVAQAAKRVSKMPADMSPEVAASAKKVTAALSFGGAKKARAAQEASNTAERTKRAGAAAEAMHQTPGVEGFYAAKHELKGALPKVEFNALKEAGLGDKEVQDLFTHISHTERLRPYEKVETHAALQKAFAGEVPTIRERKFLYQTFGPELTHSLLSAAPTLARIKNAGLEIANIPRSLMASFDVSAPFRQGLVAGARHPVMFSKNLPGMLKQFGSERIHQETMQLIHEHPLYRDGMDHGLSLTELGPLARREEQFMSNYAEHIPGGIGNVVRRSGRAYVGFLDKMRMDMYAHHVEAAQKFYGGALTAEQKHGISNFINAATGRGDLGRFQNAAVHLNTLFFSPRLLASRFNFLNPAYYAKLDPYSRREALKSMRNLVGFVGSVLFMAKLAGAKVETDPRNADWAKIKIGNTRIDLLGGFQQPVRLAAQLVSGKVISSTTGDTLTLGPGFGKMNRQDILKRFFEGKLAPTASVVNDLLKGTDFQGNPLSLKNEVASHTVPLAAQDARDMYHDRGSIPATLASYAGSAVGIGVQTYGPRDKTKVAKQASAKLRTAFEQNLKQYYQMDVPPQINKALKLREARSVYLAKNLTKKSTPVDRYNAQVDLMVKMKMITPSQSKQAKAWAAGQDKHVVAARTSSLGRMYFGGAVLSSATKKIRARGGHLWLGDY